MERERRGKEAGIRTFAFATLLGTVGMLLGENFALLALGFIGVLVGQGHTITPTALAGAWLIPLPS